MAAAPMRMMAVMMLLLMPLLLLPTMINVGSVGRGLDGR